MQNAIKQLRECLASAHDRQGQPLYEDREIRSIIDLLFEEVCGVTRLDRIMHPDLVLPQEQRARLDAVSARLAQGVPVQYAMGYTWFHGARFKVAPGVLIPRPETSELVDWVSSSVSQDSPLSLLDIGTGSGIIALTLARVINHSKVFAVDLSTEALSIAFDNSCQQGVENVQFAQCDILTTVDNFFDDSVFHVFPTGYQPSGKSGNPPQSTELSTGYQQWDIIVSNPPYVTQKEADGMSDLVLRNEPSLALFVPDSDPLLFYRTIARFALHRLTEHGLLFFEINAAYGPQTVALLHNLGYPSVELRQDINGRDRMIKASKL